MFRLRPQYSLQSSQQQQFEGANSAAIRGGSLASLDRLARLSRSRTVDEEDESAEDGAGCGRRSLRQKPGVGAVGRFGGRLLGRAHQSLGKESGRLICSSTKRARHNPELSSMVALGELNYADFKRLNSSSNSSSNSNSNSNSNSSYMRPIGSQIHSSANHVVAIQSSSSSFVVAAAAAASTSTQKADSHSAAAAAAAALSKHRWFPSRDYLSLVRLSSVQFGSV